jgi:hypothetical protein
LVKRRQADRQTDTVPICISICAYTYVQYKRTNVHVGLVLCTQLSPFPTPVFDSNRENSNQQSLFSIKKNAEKGRTLVDTEQEKNRRRESKMKNKSFLPSIHESHLPYLPKYPRPSYVLLDIPRINPKLLERNPPKRKAGIGRNCNIPVPPIRKIDIVIFPLMPPKQMKKKSQGQKKKKRKSSQIAISHRSPRRPLLRRGSFTTPTNPKEPPQTHPAAPLFLFHRRRRRSRGRNTLSRRPVSIRIQRIVAADSPVG